MRSSEPFASACARFGVGEFCRDDSVALALRSLVGTPDAVHARNFLRRLGSLATRRIHLRSDDPWPVSVAKRWWVRLTRGLHVEFRGPGHVLSIGRGGKLHGKALIYGARNRVSIGDGCFFTRTWLDVHSWDSELSIGNRARIFGHDDLGCTLVLLRGQGRRISLGEECLLSYAVEIRNCDGHSIREQATGKLRNLQRDIVLERHVWIGAHSIVLKGATIGSGSIVGAGSVVTGTIGSDLIAVGRPAVEKRRGIVWSLDEPKE